MMGRTKHVGAEKDLAGWEQRRSAYVNTHLAEFCALQLNCNYFLAHPGDPGYPGEGKARA